MVDLQHGNKSSQTRDLPWQNIHALAKKSRKNEPEGIHCCKCLALFFIINMCLGADRSDRVSGASKYCLIERVRSE